VKRAVKLWGKKRDVPECGRGVARAALEGAPRLEILREALCELRADGAADRLGIWMASANDLREASPAALPQNVQQNVQHEAPQTSLASHAVPAPAWRGVVWDRESETPPAEWEQLSGEAPIPSQVFLVARAVEQHVANDSGTILIGVLIAMRRVLWVPIVIGGRVLGVILCATREKERVLSRVTPARLAAELALELAWKEERGVSRQRYADLALARRLHAELNTPGRAAAALAGLVDSIVDPGATGGIGAAFALIGALTTNNINTYHIDTGALTQGVTTSAHAAPPHLPETPASALDFRWCSGHADWLRIAQGPALRATCQEALRTRATTGMDALDALAAHLSWMPTPLARIVAVPIHAEGRAFGVLLAGLSQRVASLATLERLEYRAQLAGLAMAREQFERRSARAARRQRAQLEASREPLFVLDDRTRVADLSGGAADLLLEQSGLPPPSEAGVAAGDPPHAHDKILRNVPGESFTDLFAGDDRPAVTRWLQFGQQDLPIRWNADEDTLEAKLWSGIRVRLRRGLPSAAGDTVVALARVTQSEIAREEPDTEAALHGMIEWLEEGVVLFDAHGKVRARNTRFEQFAGLAAGESAQGATLEELIARMEYQAAEPAKFAERWRELARDSQGGARDEVRMAQPTPRILERASRPVLDAAGHTLGRVEIYRDLTAQRMFQAQLLQTEKLAALGQMITGVAHELSNPLTSILGYAQRLLLREDAGGLSEVRQIFQEAERAGGILRQLLFSAREAPPERRRVALNQVVQRSMELQRFSMTAEKIHVELDLDPALPPVLGDASQLQQVLMNLVGNARQAIQQQGRGGTIRVSTRQVAERRVQLNVEDDGPGVPQSILARIFDPFFTTKAAGVGTGLGLSIVLSIVREHGGRVNVLRATQGGAIFSIELPAAEVLPNPVALTNPQAPAADYRSHGAPAARAAGTATAMAAARPMPVAAVRAAHAKTRILVVEDEPTVARLIADVLQDEGFLVDVLLDGREALDRAAQQSFDLVICDMKMPGVDGQHFYQSLAASGNPLRHNFLFVTGDVIAPATQAFLERTGLPHLAKPFRVEELTARVHQVLDEALDDGAHAASARQPFLTPGAGEPREKVR